ncbi:MAG: tripartite tricarboxylate transporter substrate binding protein, partial [Burkholderiaceae bacterium]
MQRRFNFPSHYGPVRATKSQFFARRGWWFSQLPST